MSWDELLREYIAAASEYERWHLDHVKSNRAYRRAEQLLTEMKVRGDWEARLEPLLAHECAGVRGLAAADLLRVMPELAMPVLDDLIENGGTFGLAFFGARDVYRELKNEASVHEHPRDPGDVTGPSTPEILQRLADDDQAGHEADSNQAAGLRILSPSARQRFLVEAYRIADHVAQKLPGEWGVRQETLDAAGDPELRDLLSAGIRAAFFHLFGLLDGVGDPELTTGEWLGVTLVARASDDPSSLHDQFMEAWEEYERLTMKDKSE